MSDKEHTENMDEEVDESIMDEEAKDVEEVISSPPEESKYDEDSTTPLPASEYLNPPERKWVLPTFLGMLVVYFSYYWFTYVGNL